MTLQEQYNLPPVVGVALYKNDVVVQRARDIKKRYIEKKRGEIMEFSERARKRLAFIASNTEVDFVSMVTLTYPKDFPCDGRMVKRHLYQYLSWLRELWPGVKYLWFLEFQKRGAPHFHILLDKQPVAYGGTWSSFQFATAGTWNNIVKGGYDHLRAGTRSERLRSPEGGKHYVVKYAQKMQQKEVPDIMHNVGRFYGFNSGVAPKVVAHISLGWSDLKKILGDWDYLPDNEKDLNRVLYNTSGTVAAEALRAGFKLGLP